MKLRALALALVLGSATAARAQPAADAPSAEDLASARVDLAAGDAHFDAGRYEDAIAAYQRGYQKSKKAGFLYNIAQAQRLAGHCVDAVDSYQAYLKADPDSLQRAQVEGFLRELGPCAEAERAAAAQERQAAAVEPAPAPVTSPEPEPLSVRAQPSADQRGDARLRWIGVGVAAVGAVGLGTSAYFMSRGSSLEGDLEGCSPEAPCDANTYADGEAANRNAWITGVGGGLLVAGGVTLILLDLAGDDDDGAQLAVTPQRGGGAVVYSGRF